MIILDLDNCIAHDAWRIPRINWRLTGDARYHDYHLLAPWDSVGNHELFEGKRCAILTGRPVMFRAATLHWLTRAGVDVAALLMRNPNDSRSSAMVKRAQVIHLLAHYDVSFEDIEAAYDDREDIVHMYREWGFKAEQRSLHSVCAYTNPLTRQVHP